MTAFSARYKHSTQSRPRSACTEDSPRDPSFDPEELIPQSEASETFGGRPTEFLEILYHLIRGGE